MGLPQFDGVVRLIDHARRGARERKLRVLLADDDPANREVISRILEYGGHSVALANDGEQALDAIEQARYDLVLLDCDMPGMGGIEALRALRLMTRGGARLPVAVLSVDATPQARAQWLEAGADAFIAEPVDAFRLLEQLQELTLRPGERDAPPVSARQAGRHGPGTGDETVNRATLAGLEELRPGRAFMEKLIGVFLDDSLSLLKALEAALSGHRYVEFRAQLRAMEGSAASMGADRLTGLCRRHSSLTDGELRLHRSRVLKALTEEFKSVRTTFKRYLMQRGHSAGEAG